MKRFFGFIWSDIPNVAVSKIMMVNDASNFPACIADRVISPSSSPPSNETVCFLFLDAT